MNLKGKPLLRRGKNFLLLLKDTFRDWTEREPFNNSVIIAYYTIFSLPGLLVIVINIAGYFYGKEQVTTQLTNQFQSIIGGDTAKDIEGIISKASQSKATVLSSIYRCDYTDFRSNRNFLSTATDSEQDVGC